MYVQQCDGCKTIATVRGAFVRLFLYRGTDPLPSYNAMREVDVCPVCMSKIQQIVKIPQPE